MRFWESCNWFELLGSTCNCDFPFGEIMKLWYTLLDKLCNCDFPFRGTHAIVNCIVAKIMQFRFIYFFWGGGILKCRFSWFSPVQSGCVCISCFFVVACKSLNSSYTDPIQEIIQNLYNTWLLSHLALTMKIKWIVVRSNKEIGVRLKNKGSICSLLYYANLYLLLR